MGGDRIYRIMIHFSWDHASIYGMQKIREKDLTYDQYNYGVYVFYEDKKKIKLLSKLLHITDIDSLLADTVIGDLLIEDINFDIIKLLASKDITKDDEFRGKVKRYLRGDMDLEEFHKEVVAYCVAEKLSQ